MLVTDLLTFKTVKSGFTLEELDRFRYIDAPARFSINGGDHTLELFDVLKLVEWKL